MVLKKEGLKSPVPHIPRIPVHRSHHTAELESSDSSQVDSESVDLSALCIISLINLVSYCDIKNRLTVHLLHALVVPNQKSGI